MESAIGKTFDNSSQQKQLDCQETSKCTWCYTFWFSLMYKNFLIGDCSFDFFLQGLNRITYILSGDLFWKFWFQFLLQKIDGLKKTKKIANAIGSSPRSSPCFPRHDTDTISAKRLWIGNMTFVDENFIDETFDKTWFSEQSIVCN